MRTPFSAPRHDWRSFDPVRLGTLERDVWVAYYRHEWRRLLFASVSMVRVGFGMPWRQTLVGAWFVLRGNQVWAPVPDNDPDAARAYMRRFYALVTDHFGESLDTVEAARLEVDWWRAHREVQRVDRGKGNGELVETLVRLYTFVYGVPPDAVRAAATHRADAMALSDRWVDEGCDLGSPLVVLEGAALVRCYASLLAAVHR